MPNNYLLLCIVSFAIILYSSLDQTIAIGTCKENNYEIASIKEKESTLVIEITLAKTPIFIDTRGKVYAMEKNYNNTIAMNDVKCIAYFLNDKIDRVVHYDNYILMICGYIIYSWYNVIKLLWVL
jgi:hypothetical protein